MDQTNEKLTIKNMLFTKAIPNYVISTPVNGHKLYACIDCGDKFIFETSYNDHIYRKSVKITYMCRHCNTLKTFTNRCNLLCHIRSHAFKTATINVSDLKVEPLPFCYYKHKPTEFEISVDGSKRVSSSETSKKSTSLYTVIQCFECKANITMTGIAYKDRSTHFMQFSSEVYSCPICLFALPTECALKVHLRIHLKQPPYYCPECGIHLANKNVLYPYNHDCEGFKMMRATARLNCAVEDCSLFHPNDYKEHMKKYHLKTVYKCPFCVVACFNETTMDKHLQGHKNASTPLVFYQCDICPSKYVLQNPKINDQHLKSHIKCTVYPCWACGTSFLEVTDLLTHFIQKHNKSDVIEKAVNIIMNDDSGRANVTKPKRIYRVLKKCDLCKRSFTYKCHYDEIPVLPSMCPYRCSANTESNLAETMSSSSLNNIVCHLCNNKITMNWGEIKKHYAELHKEHKCLDAKILLTRTDISKYLSKKKFTITKPNKNLNKISKKIRNPKLHKPILYNNASKSQSSGSKPNKQNVKYACSKCGNCYKEKNMLERHIKTAHTGDYRMAYQCMECRVSYMTKSSFSKHLLLEHDIADANDYIKKRKCFNPVALSKSKSALTVPNETLKENQCNICLKEFGDSEDLGKHYRVHGMAFLIQNTNKNNSSNEIQL